MHSGMTDLQMIVENHLTLFKDFEFQRTFLHFVFSVLFAIHDGSFRIYCSTKHVSFSTFAYVSHPLICFLIVTLI